MKNLKLHIFAICLVILLIINISAQSSDNTTIEGILNKTENTYSIGEYKVKLPEDKNDSYQFYFDKYVGQKIKFRGKLVSENLIEGDDIWYGDDSKITKDDYPLIYSYGKNIEDFIPKDWIVLQKTVGDLNNDKKDDVVLAIRGNDLKFFRFSHDVRGKIQMLTNPKTNVFSSGTDGNPRILLVLLKEKDGYKLFLQNNSFLPISKFGIGESLDKISINNGELQINFSFGDPHWGFIEKEFSFKFFDSELNLIKSKFIKNLRGNKSEMLEYNFAEKQVKVTNVSEDIDSKEVIKKETIKKLNFDSPINLRNISDFDEVETKVSIENC